MIVKLENPYIPIPGEFLYVCRYVHMRIAVVRVVIGTSALVEYQYPNGRCALNIVDLNYLETSLFEPHGNRKHPTYDKSINVHYLDLLNTKYRRWLRALTSSKDPNSLLWGFKDGEYKRDYLWESPLKPLVNWDVQLTDYIEEKVY